MMSVLSAKHIHLTGYKGVAMASIGQCLADRGAILSGSDVKEEFVTQHLLNKLSIDTHIGFSKENIPAETQVLIYTAAHKGPQNPEVLFAKTIGIQVISQAEALAELFNAKKGIAVCGVGGKSTTSAMISWIFSTLHIPVSFSVGVGNIVGLNKTGQWDAKSEYFVAEADEYVIDPQAAQRGEHITPRFSFLRPQIIVCTQLLYDHPDVYRDFNHTKEVFLAFFKQLKEGGTLIIDGDQAELVSLSQTLKETRPDVHILSFGETTTCTLSFLDIQYADGNLTAPIQTEDKRFQLTLKVPGKHNLANACAALLASNNAKVSLEQAMKAVSTFQSTQRRFEFKGLKHSVTYYDDYAHHPRELKVIIETLKAMYPNQKIYLAFQPHTYSRTKALFHEFAQTLASAPNVILTDIFASAREEDDPSISSKMLSEDVAKLSSPKNVHYIPSLEELVEFCQTNLPEFCIFMTAGAGDIYSIHDKIRG